MKISRRVMLSFLACMVLQAAALAEVRDTATPARSPNRTRIVADIQVAPDSRVAQRIAMIEEKSQDGDWLLASANNVPLLDRWRGGQDTAVPDTIMRTVSAKLAAAGLAPSDTAVRILVDRLRRYTAIERLVKDSQAVEGADGAIHLGGSRAAEMDVVDKAIAGVLLRAENSDRAAFREEVVRQVRIRR